MGDIERRLTALESGGQFDGEEPNTIFRYDTPDSGRTKIFSAEDQARYPAVREWARANGQPLIFLPNEKPLPDDDGDSGEPCDSDGLAEGSYEP